MRTLLHTPLDPSSRAVRLVLAEKNLTARLVNVAPCSTSEELLHRNPAGAPPVLIDEPPTGGEVAISPAPAISEYLEDAYGASSLMPSTSAGRAETRRLVYWFETKFESEVNAKLLRRKIDDRIEGRYRIDLELWRQGVDRLCWHLDYMSFLLEGRAWLAGERMTLADLHAAAHLSGIDYLGSVPWTDFAAVKEWYQRLKCRPSFRPLLADRVEGVPPPAHYDDLDF
ncbi:MAG: glutathione S-transferase family protein [Parvularculaceae bacterium]|nr:glutathione S-transferase family protein [Parvularculaceae bacterium]